MIIPLRRGNGAGVGASNSLHHLAVMKRYRHGSAQVEGVVKRANRSSEGQPSALIKGPSIQIRRPSGAAQAPQIPTPHFVM